MPRKRREHERLGFFIPMSRLGRRILHLGAYGQNVLVSTREEMKRDPWIEGPRIASKLITIEGLIGDLDREIKLAAAYGYPELAAEGRMYLDILTVGQEGIQRYLMGLPPRPLPMIR